MLFGASVLQKSLKLGKLAKRSQNVSYFGRVVRPSYRETLLDEGDPTIEEKVKQIFPENFKEIEYTDIGIKKPKTVPESAPHRRTENLNIKYSGKDLKNIYNFNKMELNYRNEFYPQHLYSIALHYDIFKGLYQNFSFYPALPLSIKYETNGCEHKVERGNFIKASDAVEKPIFKVPEESGRLLTLCMTSLDSNLTGEGEVLHWMLGNIGGGRRPFEVPYCQPFPARGTGYHRIVFVAYQHEIEVDLEEYDNSDRNFSSKSLVEKYSALKPVGLSFFQTCWDLSVRDFFHRKLDTEEPVYDYDWPEPIFPKQELFPAKKSFWAYLDRYKDRKELSEEVILERIARPEDSSTVDKIPPSMPTWWKERERLRRIGRGKYYDSEPI